MKWIEVCCLYLNTLRLCSVIVSLRLLLYYRFRICPGQQSEAKGTCHIERPIDRQTERKPLARSSSSWPNCRLLCHLIYLFLHISLSLKKFASRIKYNSGVFCSCSQLAYMGSCLHVVLF